VRWFEERRLWQELAPESLRLWAERFRPEAFASRFETLVDRLWLAHRKACAVAASDPGGLPELGRCD
jgi:hypothetical protein